MKVLQILPSLHGGGVEVGTLEIAKALAEAGHQSYVLSAGGPMVEQLQAEGSSHIEWNLGKKSPLTFLQLWKLRRFFAEQQFDIVHVRSRMPAWVAYLAWRGMPSQQRPRFISTMHGLHSVSAYSEVMCKGERVIAVSKTVAEYIAANYPGTDMHKVTVINRGVDAAEYPPAYQPPADWLQQWQREFPQLQGKRLICLPGRLTRLKGHGILLDLMAEVAQQQPDWHALIVGGEDPKRRAYAEQLYQRVEQLGLQQRVSFTGARRDMREIYSQAAVVLSLSTKPESFGRTTTEALTMGVPVVGFDHGGVGEQLRALFPAGAVSCYDQTELRERIAAVLTQGLKPQANNRYLKSEMIKQTLALYQELLQQ
ncbi:MAG: glycosyltransferase family 4 protein [Cellvibrionaceae bacterium]|nr:glycosyltransferase family 4 protein [Cellvibrionaceae bacterium]